MPLDPADELTTLLDAVRGGDPAARGRLVERVYGELHRVAAGLMSREAAGHSLQPTALLHEAFDRLLTGAVLERATSRAYLFGAAARAMRQVLVDHARARRAEKRGGARDRRPLDDVLVAFEGRDLDVIELHEALDALAGFSPRQADVVTLRYFGGLSVPDAAAQLGVSVSTVESDFRLARAWLRRRLSP
ncbi:MAG: ECF-type sigma factor [Gemmataceae bacterium]